MYGIIPIVISTACLRKQQGIKLGEQHAPRFLDCFGYSKPGRVFRHQFHKQLVAAETAIESKANHSFVKEKHVFAERRSQKHSV